MIQAKRKPETLVNKGFPAIWSISDSNRRPPQCECGALPTALMPRIHHFAIILQFSGVCNLKIQMAAAAVHVRKASSFLNTPRNHR